MSERARFLSRTEPEVMKDFKNVFAFERIEDCRRISIIVSEWTVNAYVKKGSVPCYHYRYCWYPSTCY